MPISVIFTYSHQFPSGVQHHDRKQEVEVEDVSEITYDILSTAEFGFLEWFRKNFQGHKLIMWEAGSGDGAIYSNYRAYLPCN